jgi:glycosyltransferase involved in cell wall biosynthesis
MKEYKKNKILLSIVIPTYNRAIFLENLLACIIPQTEKVRGEIEICISNNCSTDNTREIVANFQKKYPGLINYNENKKNLGFDRNVLLVMEMARGDFVWLLGDDDMIVDDGIKETVGFINNHCNKNTGLIALAHNELCFVNGKTNEKVFYYSTVENEKPKMYEISRKDVIGQRFPDYTFISVLLFNNNFLKKILKEEREIIEKAVGNGYVQTFLYQLMFLKYPNLEAARFNEKIIDVDLHYYKFYIEDKFTAHYAAQRKLNNLLLSSKYMKDDYRQMLISNNRKMIKGVIIEMGLMKSFKTFNYSSFWDCIKMFFRQAAFTDGLLFSTIFIFFFITPSYVLKNLFKILIKARHKEWQKIWFNVNMTYSKMPKGERRNIV